MHAVNMTKDKLTQDNEPLTFIQLGLAAALMVNRMRNDLALRELVNSDEKPNEESKGDRNTPETDEQREADKRRYVEQRLRETLAFEDRARGLKKRGR
jgi:hypothetical protein